MSDPRFDILPKYPPFYRCPADNCTADPLDIFQAVVRGPNGRQRAVWACEEHLPAEVMYAMNHLRRKTPA